MASDNVFVKIFKLIIKVVLYACYGVYFVFKIVFYPFYFIGSKLLSSKDQIQVTNIKSMGSDHINTSNGTVISDVVVQNSLDERDRDNKEDNLLLASNSTELNHKLDEFLMNQDNKKYSLYKLQQAKKLLQEIDLESNSVRDKKTLYRYYAVADNGKTIRGVFASYTRSDLINLLYEEGLIVYRIKPEFLSFGSGKNIKRIKREHLIFVLTQLSTYLKSGISLADAIGIIVKETNNQNRKEIFRNIKYELMLGESLSSAMLKQAKAFPMILINMIKSAELTGELPEVLDDMVNYFTDIDATRKQMISVLTYPIMVLTFTIAVMIFVIVYVVPKFVEIYKTMDNMEIPKFTRAIINISSCLKNNIIWILLIIFIVTFIMVYLYKNVKSFRKLIQYILMKMPVIGNLIIYNEVAILSKTFSSLLKHNVFITDSMEILRKITNNEIYHDMILSTLNNLTNGDKISDAFKNHWAFPISAYEMIVTGEKTGKLAEMMEKVSNYYQELHRNSVSRIKSLLEPIIIIILTLGVGAILLAVVIPMFNMYETVQILEG